MYLNSYNDLINSTKKNKAILRTNINIEDLKKRIMKSSINLNL
ncbi:hypothetical protein UT300007_12860 [Clostridium sp. CTA-7]